MLTKRIIPCLDIRNGRTVKGVNFVKLKDAGDPVALAQKYSDQGADELVFLDISATNERRATLAGLVHSVGSVINIPFTVGGGIKSLQDVELMLKNGADKVTVNSAAIRNPKLIDDMAREFGCQCIVIAIDAKLEGSNWNIYLNGGRVSTGLDLYSWAKETESRGAGEVLFTSMNHDGTKNGFANDALSRLTQTINLPVIASGGAGRVQDFVDVFTIGNADAALAASVFHFSEIEIPVLKNTLKEHHIAIR